MPARLPQMIEGDPALVKAWNVLVDALEPLLNGPSVCSPLVVLDGTICLGEEYGIRHFKSTGVIGKCTAEDTMGSGPGVLCDAAGVTLTTNTGAGAAINLFNNTYVDIPSGARGLCALVDGQWQVLEARCAAVS